MELLIEVLESARDEAKIIETGGSSPWRIEQINGIVFPEMNQIMDYARKGIVFFKYGKKQRMLESTYLLTDSIFQLNTTPLGRKILKLQSFYNSL